MMKALSPEDVQRIWKIVVNGLNELKNYPATFAAEMDRKREKEIEIRNQEENSKLSRSRMRK